MKFGAGPPKVDLAADGGIAGLARPTDKNEVVHLNKKYLDTLGSEELLDLYDTIIHEGLHYTRPVKLQTDEYGSDHAYIKPEAARRTAKDQSDYNKERHKCGCDQEPLTLSIHRPGLPKVTPLKCKHPT